jgi:hypothetical protein
MIDDLFTLYKGLHQDYEKNYDEKTVDNFDACDQHLCGFVFQNIGHEIGRVSVFYIYTILCLLLTYHKAMRNRKQKNFRVTI